MGLNLAIIYGYGGTPSTYDSLKAHLEGLGHRVIVPDIEKYDRVEARSTQLVEQLQLWAEGAPIHLIGHAQGGLNARDIATASAIEKNGLDIRSVTTLATPHHGSFASTLTNLVLPGGTRTLKRLTGLDAEQFTAHAAKEFNSVTPDNEKVLYLSWATRYDPTLTVSSAMWGEYLGYRDVSHTSLPESGVLDETLPILDEWEKGQNKSSRSKIKEIQGLIKPDALDLVQGVAALQEGVINAVEGVADGIFKWTPLYWLVK